VSHEHRELEQIDVPAVEPSDLADPEARIDAEGYDRGVAESARRNSARSASPRCLQQQVALAFREVRR
jgi:hypothetical protein